MTLVTTGLGAEETGTALAFQHHFVDRDLPGDSYGQTSLADIDGDGDLDFVTGRSNGRIIYWFEHRGPDDWVRHELGDEHATDVGGRTLDVDGDGHIDHVTGGHWFRNPGNPREQRFERIVFDPDLTRVHDVVPADLNGDGRPDILTMSDQNNLRWYEIPADDPRAPWKRHDIGPGVHAGVAVGDIDGDNDLDVVRSDRWFENLDGRGTEWEEHRNIPFGVPEKPYPLATRCIVRDIDDDGDQDLVLNTNEIRDPQIAWLENLDGQGGEWQRHDLPHGDSDVRGAYHSLIVEDFDLDGDFDIFTCEMEGIPGDRPPRWFIWENVDGRGAQFVERVILDAGLGGHETAAGDVDGDGDLDLVSKLWRARPDNPLGGRNHVDYLENLVIKD